MADEYQAYPKWVYYRTASREVESRLIQTPDDLHGLPAGWAESPSEVSAEVPKRASTVKRVVRSSRR